MISNKSFTPEWLESFINPKAKKKIQPDLLEKMIHALALIEKLAQQDIDYIFKGGTCLTLLLESANRFSIDVDITTPVAEEEFEKVLDKIIETSHFDSWTPDERENPLGIPKAHYLFEFDSVFNKDANNILLDVVFDEIPHTDIIKVPIENDWLSTEDPIVEATIPSIDSILGDKLTAFAPNTIGVPYNKDKDVEIIKQLYDVNFVLDHTESLQIVKTTFDAVSAKQFKYQNKKLTPNNVLEDTFQTALIIARRDKNIGEDKEKFQELLEGTSKFNTFLINGYFRIEQAQAASARAAYFASKLQNKDYSDLKVYSPNIDLSEMEIKNKRFHFLNRFKRTNKEAFYYWHQCLSVKGLLEKG